MRKGIWSIAVTVALVSSLTVVGCSKKNEPEAPPAPKMKPAISSVNMNEGQWEITTSMDMPGMPAMANKPHTFTTCLSKSDYVPKTGPEKSDCKMVDQKIDGNTVSWNAVCKDSSGKGSITYAGDSYSGIMESTMKVEGKEMTVKMKLDGKRIGACPQK